MNKHEYLAVLNKELHKLPEEERKNAIQYYIEYFDDAGMENEQRVILELGHPKEVANEILSDYAIKRINMPTLSQPFDKKPLAFLKWAIIALVASPIALPIAFCLLLFILGVMVATLLLVILLVGTAVVGIAAGVIAVAVAFYLSFADFATAICAAGLGVIVIALSILFGMFGVGIGRLIIKLIKKLITFVVERRKKKYETKNANEN